ncbi:MAG: aldo/keto reductase [Candidatus Heimdallarchaeaceae archaeon]|jgi:2,5-diketo-D-gluconate reductase B
MNEIELPKIGLGTMQGNTKKAIKAFAEAIKMGYRFLDTAQIYFNERVVGKAIVASGVPRDELIIASKVFVHNFSHKKVKRSTKKSLKRLGLEYVDIMYIHWPYNTYEKRKEDVLRAFSELVDEGKIRYLGVSNFTIKNMDEALKIYDKKILVNQVEMHPWLKQEKLLKYLDKRDIKLVSYFPIMHGRINEVKELREIAEKHNVSAAKVSLAWIISKGAIPIPKSTNLSHLKDNFTAQNLVLDEDDIKKIDSIQYEKRFGDMKFFAPEWD